MRKYILWILLVVAIFAVAGMFVYLRSYTPIAVTSFSEYYQQLADQCKSSVSDGCCMTSVNTMSDGGYKLAEKDGKCAEGFSVNMFKCKGSYRWCEQNTGNNEPVISSQDISAGYYDSLSEKCAGSGCCLSSVDTMRTGGYEIAERGVCPQGFSVDMLRCKDSLQWCRISN